MDSEQRKDYLLRKIEETKNLMAKSTSDKKYFSLQSQLNFLENELAEP